MNINRKITVLGVDQGIANLGYSVIEFEYSINESNAKDSHYTFDILEVGLISTDANISLSNRVNIIDSKLDEIFSNYHIHMIGCEKLFFNRAGRNRSVHILQVSMATGLLYRYSGKHSIPIKEYVPGTVKKLITGDGRAEKELVINTIKKAIKKEDISYKKLQKAISNEHSADSIAIALTASLDYNINYKYFVDIKESIENLYIVPEKREKVELGKAERTKLTKMKAIDKSKDIYDNSNSIQDNNKDMHLYISKDTGIPKNTVINYLNQPEEYKKLLQKEKDERNGVYIKK